VKIEQSHRDHAATFFKSAKEARTLGVVETPEFLVDHMVEKAIDLYSSLNHLSPESLNQIRWLDPSCGAGAFSIAIIRNYLSRTESRDTTSLPTITCVDTDEAALRIAKFGISELLSANGLEIESAIAEGKLTFLNEDF